MESYIRFWRLFPRMALGLLFLLSLFFITFGKDSVDAVINKSKMIDFNNLGNVFSGIIIVIFIILFCSLGLFLLELVCYAIGLIVSIFLRLPYLKNLSVRIGIADLTAQISDIALNYLELNEDRILEMSYYKNISNPELLSQTKSVRKHTEGVISHAVKLKDSDLIEVIAYYGTVTQDRKWLESLKDSITELYFFQITFMTVLIPLIQFHTGNFVYILWLLLATISFVILIPLIKERRKRYSSFVLLYYLDNFSTWEAATVVDRDAV